MARRRRHASGDTTRNLKHIRLLVAWSQHKTVKRIVHSRKEARSLLAQYVRAGATVTEQVPGEWGIYRTVRVHTPEQKEPAA